jgi:hypothetical protein
MDRLLEIDEKLFDTLSKTEKTAYEDWVQSADEPLEVGICAKAFELFLNGTPLYKIASINKLDLGALVHARIFYKWDERKNDFVNDLFSNVKQRVMQSQVEAIDFNADILTAAHKLHGGRIKNYLQSDNTEDLGETVKFLSSAKNYQIAIENLMKLSGQDKKTETFINIESRKELPMKASTQIESLQLSTSNSEQANEILKILLGGDKK